MAVVRLSNIYNPATFARRSQEAQLRLNRFLACGIIAADALIAAQFASGGNIGEITHFYPLTVSEPNYSTDDPAVKSVPMSISTKKQSMRSAQRNASWSTMDLARELALQDPVGAITNRVGHYWSADDEQRLIYSCRGILAGNVANDASDMLITLATDDAAAVAAAEKIGGEAVIDVLQTLGDRSFDITAIAMHSVPFATLQKQKLIDYLPADTTDLKIPFYMGKRVIVDDSMPAIAGVNRVTYTTMLFGGAIFGSADGKVENPSAIDRDEASGNGGGQETIYSRVHNIVHPLGFSFTSAAVAGQSATYAELATAANWTRAVPRKLVPLAFLQTNG